MSLSEFLRPEKRKVILALLLPYIWKGILLVSFRLTRASIIYPQINLEFYSIIVSIFLELISSAFLYPFACSLIKIIDYNQTKGIIKSLRADRKMAGLIIMSLLVFNPITLNIIAFSPIVLSSMLKTPKAGVIVADVIQDTPASMFLDGVLEPGRIVSEINGVPVRYVSDALEILDETKPGDQIRIRTRGGSSGSVHLAHSPEITRGYLGIRVRDAMGNETVL